MAVVLTQGDCYSDERYVQVRSRSWLAKGTDIRFDINCPALLHLACSKVLAEWNRVPAGVLLKASMKLAELLGLGVAFVGPVALIGSCLYCPNT